MTYVLASHLPIIVKIIVSDLVVSSKPGVSTRTILSPYPSHSTRVAWTFDVTELSDLPARSPTWPVRRSMNYGISQLTDVPRMDD
jgi:hypothetical protein